jgi:hypothetical protein
MSPVTTSLNLRLAGGESTEADLLKAFRARLMRQGGLDGKVDSAEELPLAKALSSKWPLPAGRVVINFRSKYLIPYSLVSRMRRHIAPRKSFDILLAIVSAGNMAVPCRPICVPKCRECTINRHNEASLISSRHHEGFFASSATVWKLYLLCWGQRAPTNPPARVSTGAVGLRGLGAAPDGGGLRGRVCQINI